MKFQKTPIAFAAYALLAAAPFAAQAAPTVSFKMPQEGAQLSKVNMYQSSACEVTGSNIKRVVFSITSSTGVTTALNTETLSPWNCNLNTSNFADGAYSLRAVAFDSANVPATATRSITINKSGTSTGGTTTNLTPAVTFTKPADGVNVPAGPVACQVSASDSDGVKQVQWFLDGKLVNTELSAPYDTCNVNTTGLTGAHVIKAVATDNKGGIGESQITVNVGATGGGSTTNPAPVLTFSKPANGANVAAGPVACQVNASDSDGVKQVQWFLDGKLVNTELRAPYDTCNVNTTGLTGAHVIKAVATDNKGGIGESQITVNVAGATANTPPTVSLTGPSAGATLSGTAAPYAANASDTGGSVAKVDFFLVQGTSQMLIGTDTTNSYGGTFDTTQVPNGEYTLMAVATDNQGATATTQRSVTISNVAPNPNPNPIPDPGSVSGTPLPSTNAKAIATFESLGLYWTPPSDPGAAGCTVRYRKASESEWKEALAMWYDARNQECRGSIVHLTPGTDYAVEMSLPGQSPVAGMNTKTWSENFPIAKTIQVQSGSAQLNITEGGSPSGYVLYTGPATLDGQNSALYNIQVSAPYVIIRGLTLKGAKSHAIRLVDGTHDVVIEDNDISGWGLPDANGYTTAEGWKVGKDGESAVKANCTSSWLLERTIIQRNKIHHPRYGSNSWAEGHPKGPNGVHFHECGGNHVFRYNEVYSETGRYFMDGYGGAENFGTKGMPNSDSDIYGNIIMHAWDDAIESEGNNRNVRVWGNYMDNTMTGVASTSSTAGPMYIFRNVWNRARTYSNRTLDADQRNYMFKSGDSGSTGKGRRYVFHNTMLQATPPAGSSYSLGGGSGLAGPTSSSPLSNTVSRNNVFHIWKSWWSALDTKGGAGNDLDYDMSNGGLSAYAGAETHGIIGTPIYAPGHGWESESGGNYQLAPTSPGYNSGLRVPNFNDGFTGAAPDMGAHEAGTAAMRFGVSGSGLSGAAASTGGATSAGGTTTGTTTGDSTSSSGVCSTVWCAATQ